MNLLDAPSVFVYEMEDGEIKKSRAIDEVINVSYKMSLIMFLCLAMFPPVATNTEYEIAQRIARLELFFEYHDFYPHFKEYVKYKNNFYLKKFVP